MQQMQVPPDMQVEFDYTNEWLPSAAQILKPVVFREGGSFCCLLGPDPTVGIFGCGSSEMEAILDWDNHLIDVLADPNDTSEIATYVKEKLHDSAA